MAYHYSLPNNHQNNQLGLAQGVYREINRERPRGGEEKEECEKHKVLSPVKVGVGYHTSLAAKSQGLGSRTSLATRKPVTLWKPRRIAQRIDLMLKETGLAGCSRPPFGVQIPMDNKSSQVSVPH